MSRPFLAGAAALLAALVSADSHPQPAPPAGPPLYQVEVMIFAYRDFDTNEERFAREALPARGGDAPLPVPTFDESTLESLEPAPPAADPAAPPPVAGDPAAEPPVDPLATRVLRPEELQLNAEYRKLERVPTYVALAHGGWVQPGLPEDQSKAFDLAQLGVMNPTGTIRVYLSRYLHVAVDVSYRDTLHGAAAASAPAGGGLAEIGVTPRYDLEAERQTRDGELQYFDHPAFGVLVKVTKVTVPTTPRGTRPAA
ncbi:MAG TPA: CsiV family protein [Gammaproteobacteria bacterium]|nr:CsiV family protein [Gammaproteobacteria bacterium]